MKTVVLASAMVTLAAAGAAAQHQHGAAPTPVAALLFDNLGSHHHPVTTRDPRAQAYFDQGLRLVYGFNHDEATRAFTEAVRLDPRCAMAYWGIGYAYGPNYNLPLDAERHQKAYSATQKALALAPTVSAAEQAYITALSKRYSSQPTADRHALDQAYADAMRTVAEQHPQDLDAATLFAEALMDLRPWDLWTLDGKPQPGTEEIVATLESVLQQNPQHPGANHYYIHAVEASPHPERALPSAERLAALVPGAGHLVHMPAHVFMRVGRYADATEANRRAAAVDEAYIAVAKPEGVYPMMYYPHNLHFLWAAASMEGRSADAIKAARAVTQQLTPEMISQMPMIEYYVPTAWFALARFGRWQELLNEAAPPANQAYASGMWHFARGMALAASGRSDEAAQQRGLLVAITVAMPPDRIVGDNTPAVAVLRVAADTMAGEIALRRGDYDAGIQSLQQAVQTQDQLPYSEPPPWYYPTRQALGAALLAAGRPKDAEQVYRGDLERNPENGWSLYGLAQSLRAQQRGGEADAVDGRFRVAWVRADVTLSRSRF